MKKFLVTGGAGFIGSAVVRMLVRDTPHEVMVVDKLTYAGNLDSLEPVANSPRYRFEQADITDPERMRTLVESYRPDVIMHLAAESHVDRSIDGPGAFVQTNVVGTVRAPAGKPRLLATRCRLQRRSLPLPSYLHRRGLRLPRRRRACSTRNTAYQPTSPYSASKAASDHFVRAWHHTYGLPAIVTNCSNNYGPYQFPEKLIPLIILNALEGKPLPFTATATTSATGFTSTTTPARSFIVGRKGRPGETYAIGGANERQEHRCRQGICGSSTNWRPTVQSARAKT